ncbi:MAG: WYL domain-containing protein [Oscillatoriales cyanobacterium SM2_3_0]|nr:WYL domain-containing protein [Oscillatoriales cyanobacterium SM2_3_0]
MSKKPHLHSYSDQLAFDRLMLLIAGLVRYPGVGAEELEQAQNALVGVQRCLQRLAQEWKINFPPSYPSLPTIRKDLETLRHYGILDRRMYRWGYYLGTGALNREELQTAFQALSSQAKSLGDPQARQMYRSLEKRLRGMDLEHDGFFYPVREYLNRAIVRTDPEEMAELGETEYNLFHQFEQVKRAIATGQAIIISRRYDAYKQGRVGEEGIWPLQLVFYNTAWYLIYQKLKYPHLVISRVDRMADYCQPIPDQTRSLKAQLNALQQAHKLLKYGWGLKLGDYEPQQEELAGRLKPRWVKVRFFDQVIKFIQEGAVRHPKQQIKPGPKTDQGELEYIEYHVKLPERSFDEFLHWVNKYMNLAQVLSPFELVKKHAENAEKLAERYRLSKVFSSQEKNGKS